MNFKTIFTDIFLSGDSASKDSSLILDGVALLKFYGNCLSDKYKFKYMSFCSKLRRRSSFEPLTEKDVRRYGNT